MVARTICLAAATRHFLRAIPGLLTSLAALTTAPIAAAADEVRQSIVWSRTLGPPYNATRHHIRCQAGSSLVGVGANFADRMVGYWYRCTENDSNGRWKPDTVVINFSIGQVRRGPTRWHDCPQDYYIVGLAVTKGIYRSDSHGAAAPEPPPLVADVQPLCRLPGAKPAAYQTPRAYFEQAHDNKLEDVGATSPPDSHACAAGTVAVGLVFAVDFRRDLDPETQFQDVALICDRLTGVTINRGLDRRPGQ